jgi:phasin family protein
MANPRQHERPFESSPEQAERKIADEANRVTRTVADFGEHAARTNVDMIQSGMEIVRHLWQSTAELTSSFANRATDQFGRALGVAGGETEATAQQSSRNLTAIMQSSQSLNEGFRKVSDEWFKFVRTRMERTFEHTDKVLRTRSPQELAAVQTEVLRDHLEGLVHSTQRIAQVSQQTADEASRKLSEAATRRAA